MTPDPFRGRLVVSLDIRGFLMPLHSCVDVGALFLECQGFQLVRQTGVGVNSLRYGLCRRAERRSASDSRVPPQKEEERVVLLTSKTIIVQQCEGIL